MTRSSFALALVAAAAIAGPASAFTFFSVGATTGPGAGDPGIASFEMLAVSFDAPPATGVVNTTTGTAMTTTGTSTSAAAPFGDTSVYQSLGTGGTSLFDFTAYSPKPLATFSVYVGSVDTYNFIDVLDAGLNTIGTISGSQLPGSNGDQGASITNRRVYISATTGETFGGLRFHSNGVAFEYDTIGVSTKSFGTVPPGSVLPSVPEPATWAMLVGGFALVGVSARRRRVTLAA